MTVIGPVGDGVLEDELVEEVEEDDVEEGADEEVVVDVEDVFEELSDAAW